MLTALLTFESPILPESKNTLLKVGEVLTIGSSQLADFALPDSSLDGLHIRVSHLKRGIFAETLSAECDFEINNSRTDRARIRDGDQLKIGSVSVFFTMLGNKKPAPAAQPVPELEEPPTAERKGPLIGSPDDTTSVAVPINSDLENLQISSGWETPKPTVAHETKQLEPVADSQEDAVDELVFLTQEKQDLSKPDPPAESDNCMPANHASDIDYVAENDVLFRYKVDHMAFSDIVKRKNVFLVENPVTDEIVDIQLSQLNASESQLVQQDYSSRVLICSVDDIDNLNTHVAKHRATFRSTLALKTKLTLGSTKRTRIHLEPIVFAAVLSEKQGCWDLFSILQPSEFRKWLEEE